MGVIFLLLTDNLMQNFPAHLLIFFFFLPVCKCESFSHQDSKPNPAAPAILYLPLGGGGVNECEPAVGAKLTQLVPLMFAGMTFTIFDAVANINNRINSNNNNNNNQNINFQQSVNTVVTGNINVANQINVMNVAGRKKRRRMAERAHLQWKGRRNEAASLARQ